MDKLWAPWRVKYVSKIVKKQKACVFCKIVKENKDKKNLILIRYKYCYAVLNLYPYNNGHSLIVTNRHVDDISKLSRQERDDFMDLFEVTKKVLTKILKPKGFNVGMNLGRLAGAGFPGHLHMHIVPRWMGDSNFMPTIAETKVISESLKTLYEQFVHAYKK